LFRVALQQIDSALRAIPLGGNPLNWVTTEIFPRALSSARAGTASGFSAGRLL
jgi:hypothetical protein